MSIINKHSKINLDTNFEEKHKELFKVFSDNNLDVEINGDFSGLKSFLTSLSKDDYPYDFDGTFDGISDTTNSLASFHPVDAFCGAQVQTVGATAPTTAMTRRIPESCNVIPSTVTNSNAGLFSLCRVDTDVSGATSIDPGFVNVKVTGTTEGSAR